jgi:hypothetical protein
MKKILFLFLFPSITYCQDVISDTIFVRKTNNTYFAVKQTLFTDSSLIETVDNYGDSLSAIKRIVYLANNYSDKIAEIARGYIGRGKINQLIKLQNDLHQQISGRPVYTSTAIRDTTAFLGTWNLNFNGEIILGEIQLNNNNRLIFNPDNGKVYTISSNLLLSTFTNQITFSFNGVKYDLYKFANSKFSTVDGDVKLIKKE